MENPVRFLMTLLVFLFLFMNGITNVDAKESRVYIVYLGEKPHNDHVRIAQSHYDMLADVVGSKEEAEKLMVYNYKHTFSGFAALLTKDQAKKMADVPGVLKVMTDAHQKLHNTWSWNSLGLSHRIPNNLLHEANMGDGIIVGVIDSGIYADSKAFSDEGLGPIPKRWKGECKSAGDFDASKHCNKKVIGARWYARGFLAKEGFNKTMIDKLIAQGDMPQVDDSGHGTHVASTVAGSFVHNVTFFGARLGTFRGGAPRARLAIYKACYGKKCANSDIAAAMDEAVNDGVDILQLSLGSLLNFPEIHGQAVMSSISSFHAVSHNVPVVYAAGNEGPQSYTAHNLAPWVISVAATSMDREFVTPIVLGNNQTIMGVGIVKGKIGGEAEFGFFGPGANKTLNNITAPTNFKEIVNGKVAVLHFSDYVDGLLAKIVTLPRELAKLGSLALIISKPASDQRSYAVIMNSSYTPLNFPVVEVDFEGGDQIHKYLFNCQESGTAPMITIGPSVVVQGKPLSAKIADFSSRGPNSVVPEILKPDIAAPGMDIIAAVPPNIIENLPTPDGFASMSGTSMAAPHISGVLALLKAVHPDWSPAALRSAMVTTAWNDASYKTPIFASGPSYKVADPFDYGAGIVNPDGASKPGLIYDLNKDDYINYLCSQDYWPLSIYNITKEEKSPYNEKEGSAVCQNRRISVLDLNLPSITIPNLRTSVTVTRTVTNVGPTDSTYRAKVKAPRGTKVSVEPKVLKFNSKTKKITFRVTVKAKHHMNSKFTFGTLTWTDGKHFVRSPLSVRTNILPIYI